MGCNCSGSKKQELSFRYTSPKGEVKVYQTEIEAKAAKIRQGGGTYAAVPR